MKIDNIIIVGGGTAGWVTAHQFLNKTSSNITVVASEEIPIVGVGESTTGIFNDLINLKDNVTNTSDEEFLRETKSTYKLGIKHSDWHTIGKSFYSPLGDDYYLQDFFNYPDIEYDNYRIYHLACEIKYDSGFQARLMKENKIHKFIPGMPATAYHLDTYKVGQYLKRKAIDKGRVNYIDDEVVSFTQDDKGYVKLITTKTGKVIEGNLFVDCTGFSRLLIDKIDKNNFISYQDGLLVNSALTFNIESKPKNYTHAWAQKYGWLWQIPTQERLGCGYVFDDSYINFEQAKEEIEQVLGIKIEPQKQIKFETGRLEKFWVKNVISTGLSSAFIEPLEATSIHCTIKQINYFLANYFKKDLPFECTQIIDQYNDEMVTMWDNIRDFIVFHYITSRIDTEFWIEAGAYERRSDRLLRLLEIWKYRMPRVVDYDYYGINNSLWYQIAIGMKLFNPKLAMQELNEYGLFRETDSFHQRLKAKIDDEMNNAVDTEMWYAQQNNINNIK
jgi:tryptophan halogenase